MGERGAHPKGTQAFQQGRGSRCFSGAAVPILSFVFLTGTQRTLNVYVFLVFRHMQKKRVFLFICYNDEGNDDLTTLGLVLPLLRWTWAMHDMAFDELG